MLDIKDFDLYYLITCSRGIGSETVIVESSCERARLKAIAKNDDFNYIRMSGELAEGIEFGPNAQDQLNQFGMCEVLADWNDEGPLLAAPKGTPMPLNGFYHWLIEDLTGSMWGDLWATDQLDEEENLVYDAYVSACMRAMIDLGEWTSCNSWRNLEDEIPTIQQLQTFMKATEESVTDLMDWNCKVLKTAADRYIQGTLIDAETYDGGDGKQQIWSV